MPQESGIRSAPRRTAGGRRNDVSSRAPLTGREIDSEAAHETETPFVRLAAQLGRERAAHAAADGALVTQQGFVALTGHDLKNDLSVVSVNAMLLESRIGTNALRQEDLASLRAIQRAVAHMDHLVSDLLDLARIDVGKLSVNPEVGDVARVTRESVESFRAVAEAKSVSLRAVLPEARLAARIDPPRIHQVLSNLLVNAIKFSPESGEVRVEARLDDCFVLIEVRDSGPGIPEGQLKTIFERYAQVGTSKGNGNGSDSGLGLGLYIARWIVDAHGGRIWARNNDGAGSTFGFCVPAAATG